MKISEYPQVTAISEAEEFVVNQGGTTRKMTLQQIREDTGVNLIGTPGGAGFGVGICPASDLPAGFTPMSGYADPTNPNYGNYQFSDGSQVVWVPRFWYKVGTGSNGLAVGDFDVKGEDTFRTTIEANAAGYALDRSFINGGVEKRGWFFDKWQASKNLVGSNWVASSIKNGSPISTHPDHNPINGLTGISVNQYYSAIDAAKARGAGFFCASIFQYSALRLLSLAHGRASTSTAYCAWYNPTKNYPKGCNNNALRDYDDNTVLYVSDGYSNCGKTGSASTLAKTTHNGQDSGIADINGNMWEIAIGMTCVATSKAISGVALENPLRLTILSHGRASGGLAQVSGIVGSTQLNDKIYQFSVVDPDNITLDGVDGTSGIDAWVSGGTVLFGSWYAAKQSVFMRDFTSGETLITDHWGATGVAAMMDLLPQPPFKTTYPNNGFTQRWGSGANQALGEDVSGDGWMRRACMLPKSKDGIDATGTDLYGKDYFYQYIRDQLCVIVGGYWGTTAGAGVGAVHWNYSRTNSYNYVGFRAACFC